MLWRLLARRRRALTALLAPAAALLAVATAGETGATTGVLQAGAAYLLAPLQVGTATVSSWLGGPWSIFGGGVRRENEELRREVERLRREVQLSRERVAAAARLERLLGFREQTKAPLLAARVIGHDASGLYRTVLIDRGAGDGLRSRQAVLSAEGAVGRVVKVFPGTALVLLLTDRSSGIDAIVQRTRDQGVVQGGGEGCVLKYLDRAAEVEVGDHVVTSGAAGGFPKGVLIGQISRIDRGGEMFQSVAVRPAAALDRLEEVWVVAGAPGTAP